MFRLEFLILLLTIGIVSAQQSCFTIRSEGGTDSPQMCKFPFQHLGRTYYACTTEHDPNGQPWCSTEVDVYGRHIVGQGKWGHCYVVRYF